MGHDTNYLKETVGEALARGCAAAIGAQPNDPVEYLGLWLLKYVKNAEVEGNFYKERQQELQHKKDRLIKEAQAEQALKATAATRKEAAEQLAALVAVPRDLLQAAVNLIKQQTTAGAAYAAIVTDPEEPDWTPPEDDEAAAAESEDEGEGAGAAEGEGEEEAAAEAEEPADGEGGEEGEDGEAPKPKIPRPVDYSKKYFAYVAASSGQEHVLEADVYRPAAPLPMVYVANVANEERIKFFRKFPKIGSYQACGIALSPNAEFKAVVAADTLFPEGSGQPLSAEDRDFVWEVSQSLTKALDGVAAAATAALMGSSAAAALEALKAKLAELRTQATSEAQAAAPTPKEGEEEEEEAPPPEEEPAPEPEEEEEEEEDGEGEEGEEGAEGEEGEEGEEPKPKKKKKVFDPIPGLLAAIEKLTATADAAKEAEAHARSAVELEQQALAAIVQAATESSEVTLSSLQHLLTVPQATYHVIKALLHLLGRDPATFATWKRAYAHFTPALFEDMAAYDAAQERDMALWGRVRSCYKAVASAKKLETEMPNTMFGAMVLLYIKQVRRVARKAVLHRQMTAKLEKANADLDAKKAALAEAERLKAEAEAEAARQAEEAARLAEEAAARAAAEAEAAAAAAAAEAEAEGAGEGEGEGAGEGEGGQGEEEGEA
ncbi:radial spoke protein 2 [Volvox carteri f. nagariensis]|uniref:Radial spoke protein 2 n=1 Tax=Volvox carteri f. nagariensis TaxID=3068 RepID=D8U667_VOLCA|nr:radial spoke protein 2 [Volvox carteri f. nagariensis]EFJ44886.1 radial spoke protein 2 [Volvox carteri f. nagariensis]|eukprot:XP_002954169.1 radial spoke protein 2 [Volvox carteri f. nagariensis]